LVISFYLLCIFAGSPFVHFLSYFECLFCGFHRVLFCALYSVFGCQLGQSLVYCSQFWALCQFWFVYTFFWVSLFYYSRGPISRDMVYTCFTFCWQLFDPLSFESFFACTIFGLVFMTVIFSLNLWLSVFCLLCFHSFIYISVQKYMFAQTVSCGHFIAFFGFCSFLQELLVLLILVRLLLSDSVVCTLVSVLETCETFIDQVYTSILTLLLATPRFMLSFLLHVFYRFLVCFDFA